MSAALEFPTSDSLHLQPVPKPLPRVIPFRPPVKPHVKEAVDKILDEFETEHNRRDMAGATTYGFLLLNISRQPMNVGNPVLQASDAWEFGQTFWDEDFRSTG